MSPTKTLPMLPPRRGAAAQRETLPHRRRPRRARAGLTLLETIVSLSILVVALLGFTKVVILSMAASRMDRETTLARQAARQVLETMQGAAFEDVFALYNANPLDDPGGAGTAPGNALAVFGLPPHPDDPDGLVGEILFPTTDVLGIPVLDETIQDAALGMPRDLNGDGDQADQLAIDEYAVLPVRVRFRWRGAAGDSSFEFRTVLMDL